MRTLYENGKGLMVFVPPTESEFALALVEFIVERIEERGGDTTDFDTVVNRIIHDRSTQQ